MINLSMNLLTEYIKYNHSNQSLTYYNLLGEYKKNTFILIYQLSSLFSRKAISTGSLLFYIISFDIKIG
jgi:hypothetical protein